MVAVGVIQWGLNDRSEQREGEHGPSYFRKRRGRSIGGELRVRPRPVRRRAAPSARACRPTAPFRAPGRTSSSSRWTSSASRACSRPASTVAGDFLQRFMPNLYQLWQNGVKFAGHYTAACACTPARGTIITGLYSQQSWLVRPITAPPGQPASPQPWLNPAYPTYGKLLRRVGYQTPYIGKWHVSIPRQDTPRLEEYGFDGLTWPDPTGANLQGTVGDENNNYTDRNGNTIHARLISTTGTSRPKGRSGCSSTGPAGRRPGA